MYLVMLRWYFSWIPKKLNTLDHQCEFETVVYNEIHRLIRYNTLLWFRHLQHFSNMAGTPKLTNWENHSHRRGIHRRQLSHSSACCYGDSQPWRTLHTTLWRKTFSWDGNDSCSVTKLRNRHFTHVKLLWDREESANFAAAFYTMQDRLLTPEWC